MSKSPSPVLGDEQMVDVEVDRRTIARLSATSRGEEVMKMGRSVEELERTKVLVRKLWAGEGVGEGGGVMGSGRERGVVEGKKDIGGEEDRKEEDEEESVAGEFTFSFFPVLWEMLAVGRWCGGGTGLTFILCVVFQDM